MSLLTVTNLSKRFGTDEIIRDLSLTVENEEFVSIIGPSGSGKSTIFNLVGGLITPDEGTIQLETKTINGTRGEISYMPQTPSLFPWRTVVDNALLGQELKGKPDREKAKQMLEIAGLSSYLQAYPHELSGGMKQRVAFIRALLSPQAVICLDEPFSALDELTRLTMQKWLLSIWEENRKTVLFVTHNIDEALFLSDRILVLSNKPAKVKAEFHIPFGRPRDESILLTEEFLQWKREIFYTLQGSGDNGKND
ncbi:ABC transporter ATP-binding protein [Bacillus sp. CECT 9360]|uniref:ABC transporter ATP-binding protein n=1 Tax=Bacillus sp. CECT 9360 TaxID=2845821 RepID=UPI001E2C8163|nr:ABC transporter ATP-binding protein [Bacillus sp. CECT 9360]CAH0344280.1 Nitrate import ATP-binding protein NrtD [Bacillus sp. CECT 9360]